MRRYHTVSSSHCDQGKREETTVEPLQVHHDLGHLIPTDTQEVVQVQAQGEELALGNGHQTSGIFVT